MAAEWLRQYSNSNIAGSPSSRRQASLKLQVGSYDPSQLPYPDSINPGDEEDLGIDGLSIASRRRTRTSNYGKDDEIGSVNAQFGGDESLGDDDDGGIYIPQRRTSISFDPKVRQDDGVESGLKNPAPKLSVRTRPRGKSLLDEMAKDISQKGRAKSETDSRDYDPTTGERLDVLSERERNQRRSAKFKANQPRWPLLQSTVDELASEGQSRPEVQRDGSLTSRATLSPEMDEALTPVDGETVVSPINISASAINFRDTTLKDAPKPLSIRSKSYAIERHGSLNSKFTRASRRSTANSASASPASAFLARYMPSSPVSQPDDEGQEIGNAYVLGREIGFGGFSVIREAHMMTGNERVIRAVKIVRKNLTGKGEDENDTLQAEFEHEIEIWRSLSHEYILPLYAVYSTDFATFAITQLNTGGTLFDAVRTNRSGLAPALTKRYAFQLAAALRYLHEDMHIIHRDIKLENCLVDQSAEDATQTGGKILLCDFGLADYENPDSSNSTRESFSGHQESGAGIDPRTPATPSWNIGPADTSTNFAGSLPYAAPELLESDQGVLSTSVDMWAFGIVLYALTMGHLPFSHPFAPRLRTMILGEEWDKEGLRAKEEQAGEQHESIDGMTSDTVGGQKEHPFNPNPLGGLPELVERCMDIDPFTRWNIQDVLCSQWLQDEVDRAGGVDE